MACGAPVTGKEFPYIMQRPAGPDIGGLIRWWLIWCAAIWIGAGLSLGTMSSVMITLVTTIYLVRILRAYFA